MAAAIRLSQQHSCSFVFDPTCRFAPFDRRVSGFEHRLPPCFSRARGSDTPQGSGQVVQITTSPVDHAIAGIPSMLASLTKGSLNAATKSLAIEYAKRGIL